jgi:hypothetical protein
MLSADALVDQQLPQDGLFFSQYFRNSAADGSDPRQTDSQG